MDLFI